MKLPTYLNDACQEIDAAVFSSDVLHDPTAKEELFRFMGRWLRELTTPPVSDEEYEDLRNAGDHG